jgi:hypothetical protein
MQDSINGVPVKRPSSLNLLERLVCYLVEHRKVVRSTEDQFYIVVVNFELNYRRCCQAYDEHDQFHLRQKNLVERPFKKIGEVLLPCMPKSIPSCCHLLTVS